MRVGRMLAAAAALVVSLGGCGTFDDGGSVANKDTLVIGVSKDQPGLGQRQPDGGCKGFDIDVASYIAAHMENKPKKTHFQVVQYADRESSIQNGTVDLVVSSYSITPERKTKIGFAGPYYVAHQDTLVRRSDTSVH